MFYSELELWLFLRIFQFNIEDASLICLCRQNRINQFKLYSKVWLKKKNNHLCIALSTSYTVQNRQPTFNCVLGAFHFQGSRELSQCVLLWVEDMVPGCLRFSMLLTRDTEERAFKRLETLRPLQDLLFLMKQSTYLNDFVLKYLFFCVSIHCCEMAELSLRGVWVGQLFSFE